MMSGYIYNPPPPPPTAPSSTSISYRGSYNNVHSGFQGGRGDGGGRGRRGSGGRVGDAGNSRGGRGGRGRGSDTNYLSQRGNSQLFAQRGHQRRIPHPLPVLTQTPTDSISPTQQLHPHLVLTPGQPYVPKHSGTPPTDSICNLPGFSPLGTSSLPPQPPLVALDSPYLSYSQEQYHAQNPSLQPLERHQPPPEPVPRDDFYSGNPSGWPAHSSYGHFESPQQPPVGRQQKYEKPDMDEAMWLRLNGGKLLGTNITPPETPEEIEAWIKERRARFPTAKRVAEDAEKKRAKTEAREKAWEAQSLQGPSPQKEPVEPFHNPRKRKCPTTDEAPMGSDIGDSHSSDSNDENDNGAPESVSTKTKPTTGHEHGPRPEKFVSICRAFMACGRCPRGDGCRFRHEEWQGPKKKKERTVAGDARKTLYQLLMENDREKENVLMLQIIKYLIDKGRLQEEDSVECV